MVDTLERSYLYQKRGVYYFSKHVPVDLRAHHKRSRLVFCLRTRNYNHAFKASRVHLQRLEHYWLSLRMQSTAYLGDMFYMQTVPTHNTTQLTLKDALAIYIRLKGEGKSKVFHRTAERNVAAVAGELGNRPLGEYTSGDAATFRDHLFDRGLASASVKRMFTSLRSIVNIAIQEQGLDIRNAFARTYIPEKDDIIERKPIPVDVIASIQSECKQKNDNLRMLVALISDTGMRLSEAAGLLVSDLHLDDGVPYVYLKPHAWRPLKTSDSKRRVPLVGAALWAAKELSKQKGHLFPQYNKAETTNSNSVSAALNKWIKPRVPKGCVTHSFRHSLRDRLRAVECPADIINRIGGWHTSGIGETYGDGYPIEVLSKWMAMIVLR